MTIFGNAIRKGKQSTSRFVARGRNNRNSGNIFFALFAAVAMVGTVGYGFNTVMRGPIAGMSEVTKRTVAESTLVTSTRLAIVGATTNQTAGGDCDGDGLIEPLPYRNAGTAPHPVGGGFLPTGLLPDSLDPWKSEYGYCAWDSGSLSVSNNVAACGGTSALRLQGAPNNTRQAIAIISAGKDRRFQTSCVAYNPATPNADLVVRTPGSDDIVLGYTYAEANDLGNGLWTPSADPLKTATTTSTPKNIEVGGSASFTDKVVLTGGGLVLPDQNSTGACDSLANDKQIRRNTSTSPPTIEICDFTGGLDWTPLAGTSADGNNEGGLTGTMVAHWKLDETSGTVARDELERLHGTLIDGPTWDATNGAIGGAINFNGTPSTQTVEIPRSRLLESSSITVSAWIRRSPSQPGTYSYIVSKRYEGTMNSYSLRLNRTLGNKASFALRFGNSTTQSIVSNVDIPADIWTHVVGVYDPSATAAQLKIYINGSLDNSLTETRAIVYNAAPTGTLLLGIHPDGTNRYNGSLDDVRIYNYGLNADQVKKVYELGVPEINLQKSQKSGRLMSWGDDANELLGNGPDEGNRDIPAPVSIDTSDFIDVSIASSSACALKKDGTVWCWGADGNGQLGNGATTTTTQSTPVKVNTINDAVQISVGNNYACALRKTGSVWCWGSNNLGKFGNGTSTSSDIPVKGPSYEDFQFISMGANTSCGIRQNGEAWCWGSGGTGQLGNGGTADSFLPVKVSNISNFVHLNVSTSSGVCGVVRDGKGYCWGTEVNGEFGNGATSGLQTVPSEVSNITDFVKISLRPNYACGLRGNGQIWCWGQDGAHGKLGNGPSVGNSDVPSQVVNIDDFIDVEGGNLFACGIRKNGEAWCWGEDTNGKLGNGPAITANMDSPYKVIGANFMKISSYLATIAITDTTPANTAPHSTAQHRLDGGVNSTCAIKSDGSLHCWGTDVDGQLGNGNGLTADQEAPYPVTNSTGSQSWVMVGGGRLVAGASGHYCGIKTDGTAWCWGNGNNGQLGTGSNSGSTVPVQVTSTTPWSTIDAAAGHSCGIKTDGTLWCWGNGSMGQLGNNATGNSNIPVQVASTVSWKSISLGSDDTCGIKVDGTLWCWGNYANGRLGLGSSIAANQTTPQQVGTSTDWVSVSTGANHTCGIKVDGTAWCWGARNNGRLGIGSTTGTSYTPEMVRDPGPWAAVSPSYGVSTCGIKMDGSLWCWGADTNGQLGNGSTITGDQWLPYPVSGGGIWKAINGGDAACGIKADDSIWCWGDDTNGKLGNGSTLAAAQHAPYPVSFTPPKAKFIGDESIAGSLAQGNMALGTQGFVESTAATNSLTFPGSGQSVLRNTAARADLLLDAQESGVNAQFAIGTTNNRYAFGASATTGSFGFINNWGWLSDNNRALEVGVDGNVGIGTNGSPAAKLDVAGGIKLSALTTCGATVQGTLKYQSGSVQYCNSSNAWTPLGYTNQKLTWSTEKYSISVSNHSCAIKSDGSAWCWGTGGNGRLGNGGTANSLVPVKVNNPGPWLTISTADAHSCSVKVDGTAWCWGAGANGRLGNGNTSNSSTPVQVSDAGPWINIQAGTNFTCGLKHNGTAWCWGEGASGQLGNNTTSPSLVPVQVQSATMWKTISTGTSHNCGIKEDGSAWCWGSGGFGQLGNNSTTESPIPVLVHGGSTWLHIEAFTDYSCGIKSDGSAWCWGRGGVARLGNGSNSSSSIPVAVSGSSKWVALSDGGATSVNAACGIKAGGEIWCWGQAAGGRLGSGPDSSQTTPVQVTEPGPWASVATGGASMCGIKLDGTAWCWGSSNNGQLGNGSTDTAYTPVRVLD